MSRIEALSQVSYRDGNWKRKVIEYWLWCDESTVKVCKILKINRPLLHQWHRWHFRTRGASYTSAPIILSPTLIAWQKKQMIKNKKLEERLSTESQRVELLQKQIAALQAALAQEQLKSEAYKTLIEIAEKAYKIEIRKKSGAKQSSNLRKDMPK